VADRPPLDDAALDLLFREARTLRHWHDRPVGVQTLRHAYDLLRWGPTSANGTPARFVFVATPTGKERLRPALSRGNTRQTMEAPVTAIVAYDVRFYEVLPRHWPEDPRASEWFTASPEAAAEEALRNSSLQGAYLVLALRALGLDAGPMSGFSRARVDAEFFPDGRRRSNFLVNIGYGDRSHLGPRNPRLTFDEACEIV
jgi:3-hydroxypropanoate dehydrogenase